MRRRASCNPRACVRVRARAATSSVAPLRIARYSTRVGFASLLAVEFAPFSLSLVLSPLSLSLFTRPCTAHRIAAVAVAVAGLGCRLGPPPTATVARDLPQKACRFRNPARRDKKELLNRSGSAPPPLGPGAGAPGGQRPQAQVHPHARSQRARTHPSRVRARARVALPDPDQWPHLQAGEITVPEIGRRRGCGGRGG